MAPSAGRGDAGLYNGMLMRKVGLNCIASVLDPRIKYEWIRRNVKDAVDVIKRIRRLLEATYPPDLELPSNQKADDDIYKSLEYSLKSLRQKQLHTTHLISIDTLTLLRFPSILTSATIKHNGY